jgi:CBS-domain-containing membrane protein
VLELTRHVDATMVPMLLAVAGAMLVARRIESRSIYSIRIALGDLRTKPSTQPHLSDFDHLISRDFVAIYAATGYAQVAEYLLSEQFKAPIYVLDHEGKLVGTIVAQSIKLPRLGAMPIEAAKAADIALPLEPLNTHMTEQQVLEHLKKGSDREFPVLDAATDRMVGVVVNATRGCV